MTAWGSSFHRAHRDLSMARLPFALALALLFDAGHSPGPAREMDKPLWIVVTAPALRQAAQPLCDQRTKQGMRVVVVQTTDVLSAEQVRAGNGLKLRSHLQKLCRESAGLRYILLLGDTGVSTLREREKMVVPCLRGTTGRMKGLLTDHGYGCLGDNLLPEVAVGRLPARSVDEARQMVAKTLAFENDTRPGAWRRRLTVLAGAPGFGPILDRMVEGVAFGRLGKLGAVWEGRAIYHNPSSSFTLPDDQLHRRALDYVQAGQALTLYLGHSDAAGFYGGRAHYLNREDWSKLTIRQGAGLFASFGCYGCQLVSGEGYGVTAIRNPHGPVAVIGSIGECFGTMALPAAEALIDSCGVVRLPERLAAPWLALHRGIAEEKTSDALYGMLNLADGDVKISRDTQRQEHLEMFILLGDPALRLPQVPADIRLTCTGEVSAGKTIAVRGELPTRLAGARLQLTLQRPLNSRPAGLEPLPKEPAARARVVLANHERANRFAVIAKNLNAEKTRFEVKLDLPAKLPWRRLTVRVYAATDKAEGIGTLALPVKAP
jgi:hypothetical protein